jgi:hypothetical protein
MGLFMNLSPLVLPLEWVFVNIRWIISLGGKNSSIFRHYLMILNLIHLVVLGLLQINNIYLFAALRLCQGIVVGNYMILIPTYIN